MSTSKRTRDIAAAQDGGGHRYDPSQRLTAARLQHRNPHWLVYWGCHSRRYWAFPLFGASPAAIVTASDPTRLLTRMREAEAATSIRTRTHPAPSAPPVSGTERGQSCG